MISIIDMSLEQVRYWQDHQGEFDTSMFAVASAPNPVATNGQSQRLAPYRQRIQALAYNLGKEETQRAFNVEFQREACADILSGLPSADSNKLFAEFAAQLTAELTKRFPEMGEIVAPKLSKAERLLAEKTAITQPIASLKKHIKDHPYALLHVGLPTQIVTTLVLKDGATYVFKVQGELVARPVYPGAGRPPTGIKREFAAEEVIVQVDVSSTGMEEALRKVVSDYAHKVRLTEYDDEIDDEAWDVGFSYMSESDVTATCEHDIKVLTWTLQTKRVTAAWVC